MSEAGIQCAARTGTGYVWIQAFLLTLKAQRLKSSPLPEVVRVLRETGFGAGEAPYQRVWRTVCRGCRIAALIPGVRNTCLVRCLVAGTLLRQHEDVVLNIGFRGFGDEVELESHAWLTLGECVVDGSGPASSDQPEFHRVFTVKMS